MKNMHEMTNRELVFEIVVMAHNGDQGAQELIEWIKRDAEKYQTMRNEGHNNAI